MEAMKKRGTAHKDVLTEKEFYILLSFAYRRQRKASKIRKRFGHYNIFDFPFTVWRVEL